MGHAQTPYPAHLATDVVLRDGAAVHVRPIRADDEPALLAFLRSLSEHSRTMRFFGPVSDYTLASLAHRDTRVDYARRFGLVATAGPDERIVAHALYAATLDDWAEAAFAVADEYQGRGLGTIMLGHLAEIAAGHGIRIFEAYVRPDNPQMVRVFRESGFPIDVKSNGYELRVTFPTALTDDALLCFERREQIAAANALAAFFAPRAVAVIGASRRRGTIGGVLFHNLAHNGFTGPVYPVNPAAAEVQGVPAYPTVEVVPGPVDLAAIAVPAPHVAEVAAECGRKGVRALIVLSAGFAEAGEPGSARQAELVRICREWGMRLIGPNCMGIANTDPAVRLNSTFAPQPPPIGRVGFSSQSGALGLAIIDYAHSLGVGLSTFVSVGNKADISGNDLLNYWESDPRTDVVLLYLESFGNPRKFARIARRIARTKPVVAVKSGRSRAGARATASHTGALLAASDVTVDALFRQAGVIRTDTLEELFDVASLLAHQPPPAGRRVGIVTNGGGPGIMCADVCEAERLDVPALTEESQRRLRAILDPQAAVANPVDMIASATAEQYRRTVEIVAADPNVDALIVIYVPPLVTRPEDVAASVIAAARTVDGAKPILTVFMSARGVPEALRAADVRLPSYAFPESAAIALARAARYGEWRRRPPGTPPAFEGLDQDRAAALIAEALRGGGGWLSADQAQALFACYGLPCIEQRLAPTANKAGNAAEALGGELALKAVGSKIVHKTEMGAVRLHLRGAEAVRAAAREMAAHLTARGAPPDAFLVQRMAAPGVEMIAGVVHDPQFGPIIACGAGGILVELLGDAVVRLAPLSQQDASEMLRELKSYPLLTGYRGGPPADIAAVEDILLRISVMVQDLPPIAELDCNPLIVHERGATIVDARVRVVPEEAPSLLRRRSLTAGA
jgi:acetyl coenzyme A synthetase (ADP forming)-like protein